MIFNISNANPIRFVPENTVDSAIYLTKHFDDALQTRQTRDYQNTLIYYQKYITADRPVIQILSDYANIIAEIWNYDEVNGRTTIEATPTVSEVSNSITGQTFKCYEFALDFSTIPVGLYQIIVKYDSTPDTSPTYISFKSEPIDLQVIHKGTIRYDYTNSYNKESMIFRGSADPSVIDTYTWTGIFRIESDIIDFKPASIDTIYDDEMHNTSLVRSRPYRTFTLAIGEGGEDGVFEGVPDWTIDLMNRILSFDQVRYDGKYFCKSDGAQFQENRAETLQFSSQRISVTESQNNFQLQLNSDNPNELMVPIQKIIAYYDNTTNRVISGVFKKNTLLEKICIVNTSGSPFNISIYTTSTGADDDIDPAITQTISGFTDTILINKLFGSDKEIHIDGIDASTLTIWVIYKKLDAPSTGTSNPYASIGVGAICYYHEQNAGDFEVDFDIATGLGQNETAWAGWAVCDGNHGTPDGRDVVLLGNDGITNQSTKPAGQTGGSWLKRILITHLPVISFNLFGDAETTSPATSSTDVISRKVTSAVGFLQYIMGKSSSTNATIGTTNKIGGPAGDGSVPVTANNFDITPPYLRLILVKKILDV